MTPTEVFGARVQRARKARGWSQRDLADRLGMEDIARPVDKGMVSRIEQGKTLAQLDVVFALSVALAVAPIHLLTPLEDDVVISVTPGREATAAEMRRWIRGDHPPESWPMDDDDKRSHTSQTPISDLLRVAALLRDRGVVDEERYEDIVSGIESGDPPWPRHRIAKERAELAADHQPKEEA